MIYGVLPSQTRNPEALEPKTGIGLSGQDKVDEVERHRAEAKAHPPGAMRPATRTTRIGVLGFRV